MKSCQTKLEWEALRREGFGMPAWEKDILKDFLQAPKHLTLLTPYFVHLIAMHSSV